MNRRLYTCPAWRLPTGIQEITFPIMPPPKKKKKEKEKQKGQKNNGFAGVMTFVRKKKPTLI